MQDLTRRQFIATSAAVGAAASVPFASAIDAKTQASRGDMSFIHLFLPGGWPCNDLWDPKPYSPFRKGMRGSELTSTVESIASPVTGVSVGHPARYVAPLLDRGLIVRSLVADAAEIDHRTAQQQMIDAMTFDRPMTEHLIDFNAPRGVRAARDAAMRLLQSEPIHMRMEAPFFPYQGWDAHEFGARFWVQTDIVFALVDIIIRKFERRNVLDRTILCISSEFNRTIAGRPAPGSDLNTGENLIVNDERDYGFHAHFAEANSIVLFGGPFKRGFVYGKTGPKHPMRVVENPVTLADIHATIATALGVQPREGRVIEDLFA